MDIVLDNFDSTVLNKKVFKLFLKTEIDGFFKLQFEDFLQKNTADIIFAFTDFLAGNIKFFQENKFDLISIRTIYKCADLSYKEEENQRCQVVDNVASNMSADNKVLQGILREIAKTSRYCKDGKLGGLSCHKIYKQWLANSFAGYASKIYFLLFDKNIIGFATLREKDNKTFLDLIGLKKEFQGKGLANLLINQCKDYCLKNEKELWTVTEGENIGATKFYQRNGFFIEELQLVYHKHLYLK